MNIPFFSFFDLALYMPALEKQINLFWKILSILHKLKNQKTYKNMGLVILKGQCHEIFDPPFFSSIDYP
jgi:hypothetical protein